MVITSGLAVQDTTTAKHSAQHVEAAQLNTFSSVPDDLDKSRYKHGDRALMVLGNERVILTEEDVRSALPQL
jgi:hypothetical protein